VGVCDEAKDGVNDKPKDQSALGLLETCGQVNAGFKYVNSSVLLNGLKELWIEHRGEYYRLKVTSNDKLILTK
jgi:hemin uptake protein HemP